MSATHIHHGFGIDFRSAIALPEMRSGSAGHGEPVVIQLEAAPCPDDLVDIATGVAAGPRQFWMAVPGAGRLLVTDGSTIAVEPVPGAAIDSLRAYLLGSALGALLLQRGLLPLHASAVAIDGRAVAFCGASGAGKSSLALHLVRRGHPLLCDDICAIDVTTGMPRLWPGLVNLKLWRESLEAVGEAHDSLQPVLDTLDKYKLPAAAPADYHSHALTHVVLLERSEHETPAITPLTGVEGISALVANTFRGQLVRPMGDSRAHFQRCTSAASAMALHRLMRPWSLSAMGESCSAVERLVRMS